MNDVLNNSDSIENKISDPVDAMVVVSISIDKLEASINIKPPQNEGSGPDIQSLNKALTNKNVIYGVDQRKLLHLCEHPIYDTNIIVAQGIKPINGIDGTYKILFNIIKDLKPTIRKDGTVDFQNLTLVENVEKDEVLCNITFPTKGTDGMTVTGKKIHCINGKPVPSLVGKNTILVEDGTSILSTVDGQVYFINNRISVEDTLFIKENVDNSTGNIKVNGNVVISGMVLPGFIVEAKGDIKVNGGVNSATLTAGGDIVLLSGINGGKLNCKGDLNSRFLENCYATVGGNINTDYAMNSNVKCGKNLLTTNSISKIVGGVYLAGENIEARIIGSSAGIKTYLELGTDSVLIKRQQTLMKDLKSLETQLDSLNSLITLLNKFKLADKLTPDKKKMLADAEFSHKKISKLIEDHKFEFNQISQSIKSTGYGQIKSTGIIHPGTTVKIGPLKMKIYDALICKSLYNSEEGICIKNSL